MKTRLLGMGAALGAVLVWAMPAMAAPPANTAAPTITGTARVGETLTAQNGTWSNSPTAFQYQWQRCNASGAGCTNVPGAVEKTYLLTPADAGRTIRVRVTGINAEGATNARSAPTAAVTPSTAPQNTARPTITGEPEVGQELAAEEGTWTNTPTSFTYQWQRCDIDADHLRRRRRCDRPDLWRPRGRRGLPAARPGPAGTPTAPARRSNPTGIVVPSVPVTNARPTLKLISARFLGARAVRRFRICDDSPRNLTILATDSRPGKVSQTRRFTTRIAPNPCGVYTRSWVPAVRFRGKGRYTVTIAVRDTSGRTSAPAGRRTTQVARETRPAPAPGHRPARRC